MKMDDDLRQFRTVERNAMVDWGQEIIMDKRQYKGYWWLPSDPKDQVAGTLTIDSRGNLKLELFGGFSLEEKGISFERKEDPVIFGRCYAPNSNMTDVSLLGCRSAITLNFSSTFPLTRYTCHYALIGIHVETIDDAAFFKAQINFKELAFWCPPKNITTVYTDRAITVSIKRQEEDNCLASVHLGSGVFFYLKENATYKSDYPKVCIDQSTYLEIQKDDMGAVETLTTSRLFERFLSVAILAPVEHGKITLYSRQKCQKLQEGKVFYHPIELVTCQYKDDGPDSFKSYDFLFSYEDIVDLFEGMLRKLDTDCRIAQIWSNLVDSLEKKRVFTSNDFLVIAQALDGFSIRFRTESSFSGQLTALRDEFKDVKRLSLSDDEIKAATGSRNYYSHILKLEKKEGKHALDGLALFDLTKKLRVLLICCALNFLGLENDKINKLLNKSNNSFLRI